MSTPDAVNQRFREVTGQSIVLSEAIARHVGLRSADLEVLGAIEQHGPLTAGQLSTLTGLSAAAVTGLIDRLEKAGVAARQADPADRRRVLVAVSDGARRIVELYAKLERDMTAVVARRSPAELQVIEDFLVDALAVGVDWVARLQARDRQR
jgi:DNA-binding MarR family transcriptional regulator